MTEMSQVNFFPVQASHSLEKLVKSFKRCDECLTLQLYKSVSKISQGRAGVSSIDHSFQETVLSPIRMVQHSVKIFFLLISTATNGTYGISGITVKRNIPTQKRNEKSMIDFIILL